MDGMTDTTTPTMTGQEFAQALAALDWKQVDFAARTGVALSVSRPAMAKDWPLPSSTACTLHRCPGLAARLATLPRPSASWTRHTTRRHDEKKPAQCLSRHCGLRIIASDASKAFKRQGPSNSYIGRPQSSPEPSRTKDF